MNRTGVKHRVLGGGQQYVELLLDRNETVFADSRALLYIDDGVVLGQEPTSPLPLLAATNEASKPQRVALGRSQTGQITNISLPVTGSRLFCRPDAVLALMGEIAVDIMTNTGTFICFSGDGTAFVFARGTVVEHQLAGNQLRLEPTSVVAMETTVERHDRADSQPLSLTVGGHGRVWAETVS